jgi:Domain of unknown function (DUF4166)
MTPLYRRLLGAKFDHLPGKVRALHDVTYPASWSGRADVERGASPGARLLATLFRLPPEGPDQALTVSFEPRGDAEVWTRMFGAKHFVSTQRASAELLHETVGPCTLQMSLHTDGDGLALKVVAARILGLPVPRFLLPQIRTLETERDGRYTFDVEAAIPAFGRLVHYRGWLERDAS